MNTQEIVSKVVEALHVADVPFLLTGSLASGYYGIIRSTQDADFVVQMRPGDIGRIRDLLRDDFEAEQQACFETITGQVMHVFRYRPLGFTIELFEMGDEPFDVERFRRRIRTTLPGFARDVWLPSPEDIVVTKLLWRKRGGRAKDYDDVRGVLAVQNHDALDWGYMRAWCERHGTVDLLEELRLDTQSPPSQ